MAKRVVVIGGGFAGARVARRLERDFAVTLIDTKNYFEFTPGILRTVVDTSHMGKIQALHGHYLHKTHLVQGTVTTVYEHEVEVSGTRVAFDYLVIASGSNYNPPIKEREIVITTRAEHLRSYHQKLEAAQNVLIVGGGLVGVELAAEISEAYPNKKITIVHAKDKLIERNSPKAIRYATAFLSKRNVIIRYSERVVSGTPTGLLTDRGNELHPDMTFMCTGIVPNTDFMRAQMSEHLNERGAIKALQTLQLNNLPHIFAVGDANDCPVEKTAQNSQRQADTAVRNIYALEAQKPLAAYTSKQTPMVISLGKWHGIFAHQKFTLTGLLPGLLKSAIEMKEMRNYR